MINTLYDNKDNEFCNESVNLNTLIPSNEYIAYFYKENEEGIDDTTGDYEEHTPRQYEKMFITFQDTELEIDSDFI